MDYRQHITLNAEPRFGKPCLRGLRITLEDVLTRLAAGMDTAEILADYDELRAEDLQACLACAADRERHGAVLQLAA